LRSFDVIRDDLLPVHIPTLELLVYRMEDINGRIAIGAEIMPTSIGTVQMSAAPWSATMANSAMPVQGLNPYGTQVDRNTQESQIDEDGHADPLTNIELLHLATVFASEGINTPSTGMRISIP
jgi:hypothetical protein